MKTKFFIAASLLGIIFLTACKKDADGIILQAHDDNRMMDSMHAMMSRMDTMTITMDPEIDFTRMMMMHHEGAISMAKAEIQSGTNDSLKRFAQKVITDQQNEIMVLEGILMTLSVDNMDMEFMQEQTDNIKKMDKAADVQLLTGDIDNDFATLMMLHHQSAIDDANAYLHHGNNMALKNLANEIISAQNKEIIELSNWLASNKR